MFGIGGTELVIILIFGFLIFGPDRLPAMGRTIGRALRQFRQAQEQMNKMVQTEIYDPLNAAAKEPEKKQGPKKKTTAGATAKPETFAEKKARLAAEASAQAERKLAPASEAAGEVAEAVVVPEKPVGRSETFAEKKARLEAEKKAAEAKEKSEKVAAAAPKPSIKTRSASGGKKTGPSKAAKLYSLDGAAPAPASKKDATPKPAAPAKATDDAMKDDTTTGKGDQADA